MPQPMYGGIVPFSAFYKCSWVCAVIWMSKASQVLQAAHCKEDADVVFSPDAEYVVGVPPSLCDGEGCDGCQTAGDGLKPEVAGNGQKIDVVVL